MVMYTRRSTHTSNPPITRRISKPPLILSLSVILAAHSSAQDLRTGFLNPPPDARPMMRWWWFGPAVTKPEIKKELETMNSVGIGGVEIQPVYPLMLDDEIKGIRNLSYLSPEFLEDVTFANQTARSLGLRVDITLGSGWPYGGPKTTLALSAGRLRVAAIPITSTHVTPPALAEGETLLAAFAVSGTAKSFDASSAKRIDLSGQPSEAGGRIQAAAGTRTALFFIASHTLQKVKRPAAGAEGYVLDHFSRAAIDEHLSDVATPLMNAFGEQPPYSVFSDSLEVFGSDWTSELPAEFEKRRGYDLIPHLPELLAGGTEQAEAIRHDWGETLSDLIRDNYLTPITQFAEAHGTKFRSQTYGEPAVTLADEAIPNLPEGEGPQWRSFSFTRWASSASHLYGRNITSAETWTWLHSPAFRATPLDMKAEADRMFLLGVNQFVGHGYPYSPPGAGEPGWSLYAAAVFNSHNPWFPVMPDVTKYLQRVSWLLRQGEPANDIAILLSEDDAQAAFTPGHVSVTDEMTKRITPALMGAILDGGYNVDYIDAATIDKLGTIPYAVLVIPPTDRIPLTTYKTIESYAAKGKVIALEKTPSLGPGLMEQNDSAQIAAVSDRLFKQSSHEGVFVDSISALPDALHHALPPDLDATGETEGLGFIHRKLADSDIYFVANTSNHPVNGSVQFRSARPAIEAWNPDGGDVLESEAKRDGARIQLQLAPYESRVFVLADRLQTGTTEQISAQAPAAKETQLTDLSTGWQIHFADAAAPTAIDKLTSWTDLSGRQFYSGEAVYSRNVSIKNVGTPGARFILDFGAGTPFEDRRKPNASGMMALLDPPIREAAIVFVNGTRAGSLWHPPYRIDISAFVQAGENKIEVHVYNTAINLLAGQPPRDYTALRARYGRRFDPQDMDNLKPLPSGLLGPIHLVEQEQAPELAGIAHAAIRVSNLEKSRDFYQKLGFEEAFAMNQNGIPSQSFLKINDRQFIELYPQRDRSQAIGFMHVCFEANDLVGLNRFYASEGLAPIPVRRAGAGNLLFTLAGPEQQNIEYTQYMPGSLHSNDRGKHLGANRIAEQILAVGIDFEDPSAAIAFYKQKLGFIEDVALQPAQTSLEIPGQSHQLVEIVHKAPGAEFQLFFSVSDLNRTAAQLKALNLTAEKHNSTLAVLDPDGNQIVFVKRTP
jgi:catechol 2,3-dioxygenase-like lactoylglutathione lyase family enzyme